jgi:hypothetical protein
MMQYSVLKKAQDEAKGLAKESKKVLKVIFP